MYDIIMGISQQILNGGIFQVLAILISYPKTYTFKSKISLAL